MPLALAHTYAWDKQKFMIPLSSKGVKKMSTQPNDLPAYRLLTGPDDSKFCHRVSEALSLGYALHGSPAATFNGESVIVAQALVWRGGDFRNAES
jgi:hypothetical protein